MKIYLIQMGGTIDKDYPKNIGGYSFEIGQPASKDIIEAARSTIDLEFISCRKKDSLDINDEDRAALCQLIQKLPPGKVVITHGTDTIIQTGQYLANKIDRLVILTGSFLPAKFAGSDAAFNLGMAIGAAMCLSNRIYIAIQGLVKEASDMKRKTSTGEFY